MDVLLLAPQPFFVDRGTPIAVNRLLRALSERGERVDVVTYPLGKDVSYPGVTLHRIAPLPWIKEVSPGFSLKKMAFDLLMLLKVFSLALRKRYQLVHAVEESVFIALILKAVLKIPYVYDMDSSLSEQMVERYPRLLSPAFMVLTYFEGLAIRQAKAVAPVCDALSKDIEKYHPERVQILRDVSLLGRPCNPVCEDLRSQQGIDGRLMMYVGNLESYQGIDLLLESLALAIRKRGQVSLVIIGGKQVDIQKYRGMARRFGLQGCVHFLGPKPVEHLADYLVQADILVSPRIRGRNTPMKIYSYLDSGKALLATNLPTHTQILDSRVAMLADPSPEMFSNGMLRLVEDDNLRLRLGRAGKLFVSDRHTYTAFRHGLDTLYDWLKAEMAKADIAKGKIAEDKIVPEAGTRRPAWRDRLRFNRRPHA